MRLPNDYKLCDSQLVRMNLVYAIVRDEILESQDVYLKYHNRHRKQKDFKIGDLVLLKTHYLSDASKGFAAKLAPKRDGPYRIVEQISDNVFSLEHHST